MQIPNREGLITIANDVMSTDESTIETNALIAIEDIGYQFGMAAAGRKDRVREFFGNVLLPGIERNKEEFEKTARLVASELKEIKGEGFSGPKTAMLVTIISTGEAIMKLLPEILGGNFDPAHLTPTMIMNWAFLYVMIRNNSDES